ncbi:LysR substrate-binding domain-containing protein [Gemmobacter aquaticus]|jgi:DNA-binding transcriptional LysR family regulator|nr:LysR substrate-binding domain-containing protein [Gemmobacter aquaticus]
MTKGRRPEDDQRNPASAVQEARAMQLPIKAIWVFHTAARAGSVARAAEQLSVTPSAVSQQIQALEVQLGVTLVNRVGRGLALTEAGERYFAMIGDELERVAEATSIIRGQRAITSLKVRATPTLSNKWLLPRLGRFLDTHPELEVRLDGTNEPTDFNRELVDVEIRHGDGRWPGLFVEGLGPENFVPVCAPSLAAPASLTPEQVMQFRLIRSVKSQAQWPRWLSDAGVQHDFDWKAVLFDRSHMAIDAACDGMGIALESNLMMWRELRDGLLVNPVRGAPGIRLTTQWIVCPTDHLRLKRVRVFLDWLREEYRRWSETEAILP